MESRGVAFMDDRHEGGTIMASLFRSNGTGVDLSKTRVLLSVRISSYYYVIHGLVNPFESRIDDTRNPNKRDVTLYETRRRIRKN